MRRLLAVAIVGLFSTGCFGRTGIGLDELEAVGALPGVDGSTTADGSTPGDDSSVSVDDSSVPVDDAPVVTTDSGTPPTKDTGIDIFDVIPIPEGGVIGECAGCVRDNCGSAVNKCINDPKCRSGLTCAVTKCLAGGMGGGGMGGLDFGCLTTCFGGDFSAAATAISAFTCVTGKCGSKCGGFLGGLPGLPGGGGAGGGKPGGVPEEWTAEQVMSVDPSARIGFASEAFSPWAAEISAEAERQASCAP
ncbi:MAG: hypothetical protein ACXWUG_08535 [Polyangiales bacterium]